MMMSVNQMADFVVAHYVESEDGIDSSMKPLQEVPMPKQDRVVSTTKLMQETLVVPTKSS
jgi:hypothetical protein